MDSVSEQFSQIYDQYIEKIYRYVYLKVNSQDVAEDLTSKVFMKGWQAFQNQSSGEQSGIKNPGAFLYQIARNAVVDHYREKGRTKIVSTDSVAQIMDNKANFQEKAVFSSDLSAVKGAILKLKKDYQDIIIWHYLEDMPIADIAKNLDKPAGTIRVMLHRGLQDLKGIMKS